MKKCSICGKERPAREMLRRGKEYACPVTGGPGNWNDACIRELEYRKGLVRP